MKQSLGAKVLAMPTPVWVVAAYDGAGRANAMTVAWGGVCCSKPPSLCVSLRAATYTHGCILERRAFTVNVPAASQASQADYLGMASGRDGDKFAAAGLTAAKGTEVDAPFVEEFPLVLECELSQVVDVGLHTQFIGEIREVLAEESVLAEGVPVMDRLDPLVYATGSKSYFSVGTYVGKAFSIGRGLLKE